MHEPQNQRQERDHETNHSICCTAWYVSRGCCGRVHIRAVDGGRVADHICDGDRDGAFDQGPWERVGYPRDNDLVCSHDMICQISLRPFSMESAAYPGQVGTGGLTGGNCAHRHEEHGKEAGSDVCCACCNSVPDRCNEHQANDVD